jgi:hypothetical protein
MTLDELRRLLEAYQDSPSWGVPSTHEALSDALVDAAPALLAVVEAAVDVEAIGPRYCADEPAFEALTKALEAFR